MIYAILACLIYFSDTRMQSCGTVILAILLIGYGLSFNVFNLSKAATCPIGFLLQLIDFLIFCILFQPFKPDFSVLQSLKV